MKKVLFICTVAVLSCCACDWFGQKPAGNDTDQPVVTTDSLNTAPDTAMAEMPPAATESETAEAGEKEETSEKDSE